MKAHKKPKRKNPREVWLVGCAVDAIMDTDISKKIYASSAAAHCMGDRRFVECPKGAVVVTRQSLRKAYAKIWHTGEPADWDACEELCAALGLEGKL